MRIPVKAVLRELKRRDISFADNKAVLKKIYEGCRNIIQSIEKEGAKIHTLANDSWNVTKENQKLGDWLDKTLIEAQVLTQRAQGELAKVRRELAKHIGPVSK